MYLKKVIMQGFKSFADKTEINFEDNITAIVGPNGSGKSNVSDAVKWVLGEQSAKNLRGGKMEDIIFSGTDKRNPLGFAEVSVIFSNPNRTIPIDYSEVAVTRRMFRSGDSEFYINKNSCRLRDIRELFMDTGIGRDGYSIIGQGKVDQILSDRPEDRRHIFEEAAGIVKYRSKKEETERKLKRTDENLVRINDLVLEIGRQNNSLERDAKKAKEYLKIYEELKKLELNLYINDISNLNKELSLLVGQTSKLDAEINTSIISKNKNEDDFKRVNLSLEKIVQAIKEIESRSHKLDRKMIEEENELRLLEEKKLFMKREKTRLEEAIEKNNLEIIKSNNLLEEKKEFKKNISIDIKKLNKDLGDKEEKLKNLLKLVKEKEESIEENKDALVTSYNKSSDFKSKLNSIDSFEENIKKRIDQLLYNVESYRDKKLSLEDDLTKSLEKEKNISEKSTNLLKDREKYMDEAIKVERENQKLQDEIQGLKVDLQGYKSNYNLYKNMEDEYDGYYRSVKNLLLAIDNQRFDTSGFVGVVADLIQVKSGYEKAIDVTLGSNVQNIVTEDEGSARDMIKYLRQNNLGRATFLPLTRYSANNYRINPDFLKEEGVLGLAKDFVEYNNKYSRLMEYLLARTIIVDNIDNAIKFSKSSKVRQRIVTLEGDIINASGAMTGGSFSKNVFSIISRKNKILELDGKIKNNQSILGELMQRQEEYLNKDTRDKEYLEKLDGEIRNLNLQLMELSNTNKNLKTDIERLSLDIVGGNLEIESLKEEKVDFDSKRQTHQSNIKELDEISSSIKSDLGKDLNLLEGLKEDYDSVYGEVTNYKIKTNDLKNSLGNIELEEKSILENLNISNTSIKVNSQAIIEIESDLGENSRIKEEISKKIKISKKTIQSLQERSSEEEVRKNEEEKKIEEINLSLKNLAEKLISLERDKNDLELKKSRLEMRLENLEENLYEDYNYTYRDILRFKDKDIEIERSREKVVEIKSKIKKLGNINLDSLREYEDVNERYIFLKDQEEDLRTSKYNLEKVIKDIEKEMTDKFLKSIEIIDKNFSKIFKVLFNGGSASIKIEKSDNILEAGIEIEAQPPGKRLQNIRLLSGGEKSMTAVALLFSILEMKPSPFCILDEIDAALDDANIGRYTDYLKSLNEDTQFILITHRKPTMEISNVLYGVTMLEEGVSELYSMKMKDYE